MRKTQYDTSPTTVAEPDNQRFTCVVSGELLQLISEEVNVVEIYLADYDYWYVNKKLKKYAKH
jgi:hypothetical protein